ncbi:MAG: hypothetical protein C0456_02130 [Hyphomonas sp.]|uniref:vWA domain-containing protein n=1 Tax=Hyphomonas sp. TaxID=87 RepID=UPI001DA693B7|nr:vWA domain-containing protein [Hyphomonas sp.]MBA4225402.1 hypothetical protein [Hyphomonas sp.]
MIPYSECYMRRFALLVAVVAAFSSVSLAQVVDAHAPAERVTYFLIDASGSMNERTIANKAELEVSKTLEKIKAINPNAPVSRTYFKAPNRDFCSHPITIANPVPASDSVREFVVSGNNDYTPLGNALASAVTQIGDNPADVFIITDGHQTPDCGLDFCSVARELLPRANLNVQILPVGNDPVTESLATCVDRAKEQDGKEITAEKISDTHSKSKWDEAGLFERWLWLFITMIVCAASGVFGSRDGLRAKDFEHHSGLIQENERVLLTRPENASDLRGQIKTWSAFKEADRQILKWLAWGLLIASLAMTIWLLFCDASINDFELSTARAMGWFVLSSNFSTAFAVLVVTPIIFAFSQNWRRLQAQRTFAFVAGLAAQEEAARLRQEFGDLYKTYLSVRDSVLLTELNSNWTNTKRFGFRSVRPSPEFSQEDLGRLERVKRKLLQVAQGPMLQAEAADTDGIKAAIQRIQLFAPRPLRKSRTVEQMIEAIGETGWFGDKAAEWKALNEAIRLKNVPAIKEALSNLD